MKKNFIFLIIISFLVIISNQINVNQPIIIKTNQTSSNDPNIEFKITDKEDQTNLLHVSDQVSEFGINQDQRVEFGETVKSWLINNNIGGNIESEMNAGRQIVFSPTGRYIATGGGYSDPTPSHSGIRVWDLATDMKYSLQSTVTNTDLSVETLAFSPDEKYLATAGYGIHLWNITLGNEIKTLSDSDNFRILHILFSKDGTEIIASVYQDLSKSYIVASFKNQKNFQILFWNVETGILERDKNITLSYYSRDIDLSPDGLILVTGNYYDQVLVSPYLVIPESSNVTLWNLSTNKEIAKLTGFTGAIRTMKFSSDGKYLAIGSVTDDNCFDGIIGTSVFSTCNSNITVWDMQTYKNIFSEPLHAKGIVYQFGFSSRDNLFFSSSYLAVNQKDLQIWKISQNISEPWVLDNFSIQNLVPEAFTTGSVENFFAISPNQDTLAYVWSNEEPIHLINIINDKNIPQTTIINQNPISSVILSPSKSIISCDTEGNIKIWNVTTHVVINQLNDSLISEIGCPIDYSPYENIIISGNSDGSIHIYNFTSGALINSFKISNSSVISTSFSSDGKWLATGSADGKVVLWNTSDSSNISKIVNLPDQISGITALMFSPDNTLLASGSLLSSVILWNLSTFQVINALLGHTNRITSLAFSPDGNTLAAGSWDKSVIIWNVHNGKINAKLVSTSEINSISYLYSNNEILEGGNDGILYLWNIQSGFITADFRGKSTEIMSIFFSKTTNKFVTGNIDGDIEEWDIHTFYNDTDGDGIDNTWEINNNLNPNDYFDLFQDTDNDGLINSLEYKLQTNPNLFDTDYDGMPDEWEFIYHTNPNIPDPNLDADNDKMSNIFEYKNHLNGLINDSMSDLDGDGLTNFNEFIFGSYAYNPDNDGDGMSDLYEYQMSSRDRCLIISLSTCRHYNFINFFNDSNYGWLYTGLDPLKNDSYGDLDRDGMPNIWEYHMGLLANSNVDSGTTLTAFNDKDHDGIPNLVEYLNGLNALDPLDANYDHDSDGIPNLVEYKNGLNISNPIDSGLVLTAYNDKDHDLMPNLWEYRNTFNMSNQKDAFEDPDFDLVSNLNEYRGGSNPHDIFSVPIYQLSILHISLFIILLVISIILVQKKIYKSIKKQLWYNSINAPNHSIADHIYKAGFVTYDNFQKAKREANELLTEAILNSDNGLIDQSIEKFLLIMDLLPFKGNDKIEIEAIVRLALLLKDQELLKENSIVFKNIPKKPSNYTIGYFKQMLEALREEMRRNWGEALKLWTNVSKLEKLPRYYEIISQRSITEQYFRIWFYEQNELNENEFKNQVEQLKTNLEKYNEKEELCRLSLLKGRYFLAKFDFNDFEDEIEKCSQIVNKIEKTYYKLYVDKITEELLVDSKRLQNLIKSEGILLSEDKDRIIKKYIEKATMFINEIENSNE